MKILCSVILKTFGYNRIFVNKIFILEKEEMQKLNRKIVPTRRKLKIRYMPSQFQYTIWKTLCQYCKIEPGRIVTPNNSVFHTKKWRTKE